MTELESKIDLTNCDKEPIHIPGAVQPHGVLLVLDRETLNVVQLSANVQELLGQAPQDLLGTDVRNHLIAADSELLTRELLKTGASAQLHYLPALHLSNNPGRCWTATLHRLRDVVFLELEPDAADPAVCRNLKASLRETVADLDTCESLPAFCESAAHHFRHLTGFDRVMVYRFLEDGVGVVVSEARDAAMEPYLGLHYPASDIPAQARQLYLVNPFRLTANVDAPPVPLIPALNPKDGQPLDMSFCALRATSPVHLQYLRNMGVAASLSLSILHQGRLWGLIACHHRQPKAIAQDVRISAEILARLVSLQVGLKEDAEHRSYIDELQKARLALGAQLSASGDFGTALTEEEPNLLSGIQASGAALCTGTQIYTIGRTPDRKQIEKLSAWANARRWRPVWSTHCLSDEYGPAKEFAAVASGALILRITARGPESVIWFRPEVVQTVNWAGNPSEPAEASRNGSTQLHPRRSFALWKEQVSGQSLPWKSVELEHASGLQETFAQALLQHRAQEISRLNAELVRSNQELDQFASIASHDLQEPLRTITTYTQLLLRKRQANPGDLDELGSFIVAASRRMSGLVDSLLEFARVGRDRDSLSAISSEAALQLALTNLDTSIRESGAQIRCESELPAVLADTDQLARVFQNLISNAIKYRDKNAPPEISIRSSVAGRRCVITIKDNGIGFDATYAKSIFQSFQRLHGRQYEGSGLGLTICRKIIESFGGRIWAESEPGVGSSFSFSVETA